MNAVQRCGSCGAGLTLDQMRRTDCPYCNVVYPHHARAVEQAALVNQIMAQQAGGLYGAPQQPPITYGVTPGPAQPPHMMGSPYNPYNAYNANVMGAAGVQIERAVTRSLIGVFIAVGIVFVLMMAGGAAAFLLAR